MTLTRLARWLESLLHCALNCLSLSSCTDRRRLQERHAEPVTVDATDELNDQRKDDP